jgi:hypothetical protein
MRYVLLIYGDEHGSDDLPAEQQAAVMDEWWKYTGWLEEEGWKVAGEALHGTDQATTIRIREGSTMTTDGPFAETKEQLGGFYLLECANLDEALEAAAACPGARTGSIEVRPVVDFSQEAPS